MRMTTAVGAAMLMVAGAGLARAADLTSGVPVDGKIGAYSSTKCGGADDGVEIGKSLCYT
jgi:hypothetical protein